MRRPIHLVSLLFGIFSFMDLGYGSEDLDVGKNKDFDFLIFAQIWPMTDCILWQERSHANRCILQSRPSWTIHGIWPTKKHTMGPFHCNDSQPFDKNAIQPILPDLTINWLDIRDTGDKYAFWRHEWEKHGTCAEQIPALNSEIKYFSKALELHQIYNPIMILAKAEVIPGAHYSVDEYINPIKKFLNGTQPGLECAYDHDYKRYIVAQINICFDKQFNLMNCTDEYGGLVRNCPKPYNHEQILYPGDSGDLPGPPEYNLFGIVCGIICIVTLMVLFGSWVVGKVKAAAAARAYEEI